MAEQSEAVTNAVSPMLEILVSEVVALSAEIVLLERNKG